MKTEFETRGGLCKITLSGEPRVSDLAAFKELLGDLRTETTLLLDLSSLESLDFGLAQCILVFNADREGRGQSLSLVLNPEHRSFLELAGFASLKPFLGEPT